MRHDEVAEWLSSVVRSAESNDSSVAEAVHEIMGRLFPGPTPTRPVELGDIESSLPGRQIVAVLPSHVIGPVTETNLRCIRWECYFCKQKAETLDEYLTFTCT